MRNVCLLLFVFICVWTWASPGYSVHGGESHREVQQILVSNRAAKCRVYLSKKKGQRPKWQWIPCVEQTPKLEVKIPKYEHKYDPKKGYHNISLGVDSPDYHDRLIFEDKQLQESVWFPYPKVISKDVCYPSQSTLLPSFNITRFNVTDQVPEDKGGFAFITKGGVGQDHLCLHLKTQRGGEYKFLIEVWGV